jgi:hypothetical protein
MLGHGDVHCPQLLPPLVGAAAEELYAVGASNKSNIMGNMW